MAASSRTVFLSYARTARLLSARLRSDRNLMRCVGGVCQSARHSVFYLIPETQKTLAAVSGNPLGFDSVSIADDAA